MAADHTIWTQKFDAFEAGLNGQASGPIHALRKNAIDAFSQLGYPTSADEAWKSINVSPVTSTDFAAPTTYQPGAVSQGDIEPLLASAIDGPQLVFVNGQFAEDLSRVRDLPEGVRVESLARACKADPEGMASLVGAHASTKDGAFTALNTAFLHDGAFILAAKNTVFETPVNILFLTTAEETPIVSQPRSLIVAEPNSQIAVVETFAGIGAGQYFTNAVTEIVACDNAQVDHYKIQLETLEGLHVSNLHTDLGRSSNVRSHAFSIGGAFVRNDVTGRLLGEGGEATLNGFYLLEGDQHIDNYTLLEHAEPHCPSHELYKGILGGASRAVFRGKIHVHQKAQQTDAYQQNENMLLSDDARVNTKPQLEIYADDVKCSHGATVGQIDETALFYLRARGIPRGEARRLLLKAFADDIVERVRIDWLRQRLDDAINVKLARIHETESTS